MDKKTGCIVDLIRNSLDIKIPFGGVVPAKKVLVLSPHHDDEMLGCGGTLLKYMESNNIEIMIVYFTDGRYGIVGDDPEERRLEAENVWANFPYVRIEHWDYEDSKLNIKAKDLDNRIKSLIEEMSPDIIFTPWMIDVHKDHETVSLCLSKALGYTNTHDCYIACYEVAFPLFANHTVNITKQIGEKMKLLDLYKSQLEYMKIKEFIYSLNSYRAQVLRFKSVKAAEGFFVADKVTYIKLMEGLFTEILG